jgi:hypothetical protein
MFDTQGKVRLATPDSPSGNSATNNTLVLLDEGCKCNKPSVF